MVLVYSNVCNRCKKLGTDASNEIVVNVKWMDISIQSSLLTTLHSFLNHHIKTYTITSVW